MDAPAAIASGAVPGVKAAAVRKLRHELGVSPSQLPLDDFRSGIAIICSDCWRCLSGSHRRSTHAEAARCNAARCSLVERRPSCPRSRPVFLIMCIPCRFLTRLHYCAADPSHVDEQRWGEHEVDHILFIRATGPRKSSVHAIVDINVWEAKKEQGTSSDIARAGLVRCHACKHDCASSTLGVHTDSV